MGIAERIDFAVFSSEVGKRKPHPEIFERALEALEVAPWRRALRRRPALEDVRGAAEVGMTTVQALWFRADEQPDGAEPDHQAFTQMDVLNIADRLLGSCLTKHFPMRLSSLADRRSPCRQCPHDAAP